MSPARRTKIGLCAAAATYLEQMVRLVAGGRDEIGKTSIEGVDVTLVPFFPRPGPSAARRAMSDSDSFWKVAWTRPLSGASDAPSSRWIPDCSGPSARVRRRRRNKLLAPSIIAALVPAARAARGRIPMQ